MAPALAQLRPAAPAAAALRAAARPAGAARLAARPAARRAAPAARPTAFLGLGGTTAEKPRESVDPMGDDPSWGPIQDVSRLARHPAATQPP
jgi:hypothetical protein